MNPVQILCALLTAICTHVTSVEAAAVGTGKTGTDKKTDVLGGVESFITGLVNQGVQVVADDVRKIAGPLIDHVVTAAHAFGVFTHGSSAVPTPPTPQP